MLVDPRDGTPIGNDKSALADIADSTPSVLVTMGWNMRRGTNTIIGGGTAARAGYTGRGMGGIVSGGLPQTFNPTHFGKLTRPANIDPSFYGKESGVYTPFGALAKEGNRAYAYAAKHNTKFGASMASRYGADAGSPFAAGTAARISAMTRINKMDYDKFIGQSDKIMSGIRDINPGYYENTFMKGIPGLADDVVSKEAGKYALSAGVGSTMKSGFLSARAGGYIQGASAAYAERAGTSGAIDASLAVMEKGSHFAKGFDKGAGALYKGGKFAEFAGSGALGSVLRGANVASSILLVHDLAEMAGKAVGHMANTALDAGKSAMGSLDKGVMGMGFKDNSVAATSRSRGVLAIQNSRLNMRSYLGSEASGMSQHFG